jgi:glycosyltransferase involved in cell wall biosynthesis
VRAVHHPKNRGYGGALQTGFRSATKEFVFYTDGDAQYYPAELAVLWARMTRPADLGQRLQDQPFGSVAPHRHRPGSYHHFVSLPVRLERAVTWTATSG